jgi:hypothetical protein
MLARGVGMAVRAGRGGNERSRPVTGRLFSESGACNQGAPHRTFSLQSVPLRSQNWWNVPGLPILFGGWQQGLASMRKQKAHRGVKFSSRVVRTAVEKWRNLSGNAEQPCLSDCTVSEGNVQWTFDSIDEFLPAYGSPTAKVISLTMFSGKDSNEMLAVSVYSEYTHIYVASESRSTIETVHSIFDEAPAEDRTALVSEKKEKITIFIGHGRNDQWEKLKSHLQDKHNLKIVAYETGARAGHTIRDILDNMAKQSTLKTALGRART